MNACCVMALKQLASGRRPLLSMVWRQGWHVAPCFIVQGLAPPGTTLTGDASIQDPGFAVPSIACLCIGRSIPTRRPGYSFSALVAA
jgi:hypothetical protein